MIASRTHRFDGATRDAILEAAQQPRASMPANFARARRRIKEACVLNADRLRSWALDEDPILELLRGMIDPETKLLRSPEELERRWLTRMNEVGSCGSQWQRVRCRCCHTLRASLLVCNQRFCPHCIATRRKDLEQRVRNMLRAVPQSCAVFPVVLPTRTGSTVIGSSTKLFRKFNSFLKDP